MACPACGASVPEGSRFCPACGSELAPRGEERRVATVLFADLVGFTSLSERRDPEQVKRLVDRCFERLIRDIETYGGVVDKVIGDAIVALFGAPVAHEDDPERAVRAALAMQATLARESSSLDADIRMRVGVNTGEVVVGSLAGGDYTAMGDVVNTASRLQTTAAPGGVLVGPSTYAPTKDAIRYRDEGLVQAKGRDAPVHAWAAEAALLPPGYRQRRHSPLVGRDEELGMLQHAINSAVERRRGHLILLVGEAGVGKTRLAEEIAQIAAATHDAIVLEGRCVPYGEANVWWPVAEALRQGVGLPPEAALAEARPTVGDAVASVLAPGAGESGEVERITDGLLYLLGYEGHLRSIDPQRAREEATRSVLALVEASTAVRPVLVVLSDMHWADVVVLEMIETLMDRLGRERFVLVATARKDLYQRWSGPVGRHNQVVVNLDPLDREATTVLLDSLVEGELPRDVESVLLDRSGGNPFFLEELVALVAEADSGALTAIGDAGHHEVSDLPDTLRGLVAARLDALSSAERRLLEDASVWGRRGRLDVLERMAAHHDRPAIDVPLQALVDKEILVLAGRHWQFRSELMRDVAYGTLTKSDRARTHHGIAQYLEPVAGASEEAHDRLVDVVAHHYAAAATLAGELGGVGGLPADLKERALAWIEEAASRAEGAQVHRVSIRMFGQALRLVGDEPCSRRVDLLLGRAHALAESRRLEEANLDVVEAEELADRLSYARGRARAEFVRGLVIQHGGDLDEAVSVLSGSIGRFEAAGDRKGEADARRAMGLVHIFRGDQEAADTTISAALEISRELGDRRGEAWAHQQLAWISFSQGKPGEADDRLARAASTFEALGDTGGLAWVNGLRAWVRFQQGRYEEAESIGEEVLVEALAGGDRWAEGMMLLLGASVRLWSGRASSALSRAEEALARFREIGDSFGVTQSLAVLSRVLVMLGRVTDGFRALEAATVAPHGLDGEQVERLGGTVTASVAVQIGDVRRAEAAVGAVSLGEVDLEFVGDLDRVVAFGLTRLQAGAVGSAVEVLEMAALDVEGAESSAYALSALALAYAAEGRSEDVLEVRERVGAVTRGTYLDRATADIAAALSQVRRDPDRSADGLAEVIETADSTDDQILQAVARLAAAVGSAAAESAGSSAPGASADRTATEAIGRDAENRLLDLGIEARGWRRLFETIVSAEV